MVQNDIPRLDIERYVIAVQVHVAAGRPGLPFLARRELRERVESNPRLGRRWWIEHEAEIRRLLATLDRQGGLAQTVRGGGEERYAEMDARAAEAALQGAGG